MAGIPTSTINQPGSISVTSINRQVVSDLQLLTPQYWNQFIERYGSEMFSWWLATYGGMEEVKNQEFFWFEAYGKLMSAVQTTGSVSAGVGATITLTLATGFYYSSGTEAPIAAGQTWRVASSNIEGVILAVDTTTPNAWTFTIRPKISTDRFASAGSTSLLTGETLIFGGYVDVGEASDSDDPMLYLTQKRSNTITEIRATYSATDLAEMTDIYPTTGVTGDALAGMQQAGTSYFTQMQLLKTATRFANYSEDKLMYGDIQNNTGLSNSVGAQGFIPAVMQYGEGVSYSGGNLDIAKLHEITRIMDVQACAKQAMWIADIFQNQAFSDGLFAEFPAGAFVWGQGEASQAARVAYGFREIYIDGYMLGISKYKNFNTEYKTGVTPTTDAFRNFGIICPNGTTVDAKDKAKTYKNLSIMYQQPPKGGTIGNGIRVWSHGGGSVNPTSGKMEDNVEMITYRSTRLAAGNQFLYVQG